MHALAARIRSLRPGLRVTVGFLEFNGPPVREALAGLYGDGEREVTAVPLLPPLPLSRDVLLLLRLLLLTSRPCWLPRPGACAQAARRRQL